MSSPQPCRAAHRWCHSADCCVHSGRFRRKNLRHAKRPPCWVVFCVVETTVNPPLRRSGIQNVCTYSAAATRWVHLRREGCSVHSGRFLRDAIHQIIKAPIWVPLLFGGWRHAEIDQNAQSSPRGADEPTASPRRCKCRHSVCRSCGAADSQLSPPRKRPPNRVVFLRGGGFCVGIDRNAHSSPRYGTSGARRDMVVVNS